MKKYIDLTMPIVPHWRYPIQIKPVKNMKEAVELVEAVEETGLVYNYAENYCFREQILEMRRLYETGELGTVMACEGVFINDLSKD